MHLLVTGAAGLLAHDLVPLARERGHQVTALTRAELDVTDFRAVADALAGHAPDMVVNLAAYTDVDAAEAEPDRAFAVNRDGPANLSHAVGEAPANDPIRLLHLSTDYIFDGAGTTPYPPDHPPNPLNVYGKSKLAGEAAIRAAGVRALIVRTSWLYGAGGGNFVDGMLGRAEAARGAAGGVPPGVPGGPSPGPTGGASGGATGGAPGALRVVDDQRGRPTWTRSLARTLLALIDADPLAKADDPVLTLHAADSGEATWCELAREALRLRGLDVPVEPVPTEAFPRPAPRPRNSVLDLRALVGVLDREPPHWTESLAAYLAEPHARQPRSHPA